MVHFGEFLKKWSLRSNSVTRQVSFNRTKIGEKCQKSKNSNATFWVIFKQCDDGVFVPRGARKKKFFCAKASNLHIWRKFSPMPLLRGLFWSCCCCCWYLPVILSIYIFLQKLEMSLSSHIQVVRRQQQQAHLEIFSDVWGGSGGRWQLLEGGISCGFLIFHFFFSVCYYSQNLICCWDLRWEMASNSSKSDVFPDDHIRCELCTLLFLKWFRQMFRIIKIFFITIVV